MAVVSNFPQITTNFVPFSSIAGGIVPPNVSHVHMARGSGIGVGSTARGDDGLLNSSKFPPLQTNSAHNPHRSGMELLTAPVIHQANSKGGVLQSDLAQHRSILGELGSNPTSGSIVRGYSMARESGGDGTRQQQPELTGMDLGDNQARLGFGHRSELDLGGDRDFGPTKGSYGNILSDSNGIHEPSPPSPRASRKLFSKMVSSALVKPRAPIMHKGKLAIRFTRDEIDTLASPYKFSLVAKVINGWIDLARFRVSFARLGLTSNYTIRAMRVGYFHVHCSIEEDFNRLLIKSEFLFAGASVKMFRWTPYFDFETEPTVVPIWVNFWDYHVHMLDVGPLMSYAATLGNPIALDEATVKRARPNHARVCIEIDLEKERIYEFTELVDDWERTFHVEYENLPPYCSNCRVLGHVVGECGKKRVVIRPKKDHTPENGATKAPTTDAPKRTAPNSQPKKTGEWIEVGRKNRLRRNNVKNQKNQDCPDPNATAGNDGSGPKQHDLESNGSGQAAGSAGEKAGENAEEKESAEENTEENVLPAKNISELESSADLHTSGLKIDQVPHVETQSLPDFQLNAICIGKDIPASVHVLVTNSEMDGRFFERHVDSELSVNEMGKDDENVGVNGEEIGGENGGEIVKEVEIVGHEANVESAIIPLNPNATAYIPGTGNSSCGDKNEKLGKIDKEKVPKKGPNKKKKTGPPVGSIPNQPYDPPATRSRAGSSRNNPVGVTMEEMLRERDKVGYNCGSRGYCHENRFEPIGSTNGMDDADMEFDYEAYQTEMIFEDCMFEKTHRPKLSL